MENEKPKANWRPTGGISGNVVLDGGDFSISFASAAGLRRMGALFDGDGSDETALISPKGEFFILNGDYRESYEQLVPEGYDACKRFYDQQAAHAQSSWSGR